MGRLSKSKSKQTVDNVTTSTPTVAPWLDQLYRDQGDRISNFAKTDPSQYVAGMSSGQTAAVNAMGKLGGWQDMLGQGFDAARRAASSPANEAGPAATYNPAQAGFQGYDAAQGKGQGYDAVTGAGQGYTGQGYTGQGYTANQSKAAQIGPMARMQAALTSGMDRGSYMNPYVRDVVDATMADYDQQAGRTRASQAAQGALNNAFGGSRYAIQEAATEGELARGRASSMANLLSSGFDRATAAMQFDAGQQQQANSTNTGYDNSRTMAQAGYDQQANLANQDALNQAAMFGANATNTSNQFNANANNDASRFTADANNRFGLANMDAQNQSRQFGADANNRFGLANMDARNQAAQFGANAFNQNSQFNANSTNDAGRFNAGANNDMSRFNADQRDKALARQLQAAGLMGQFGNDYGSNSRNDITSMLGVGDMQRGVDQAQRNAAPQMLQLLGLLNGQIPIDAFTSRTGTEKGTTKGSQGGFGLGVSYGPNGFSFG